MADVHDVPDPPDIHHKLVALKLNPDSKCVQINCDPLRKVLMDLVEWMEGQFRKSKVLIRDELDAQFTQQLHSAVQSKEVSMSHQQLQAHSAGIEKKTQRLEADLEGAAAGLRQAEEAGAGLAGRVEAVEELVKSLADEVGARAPSPTLEERITRGAIEAAQAAHATHIEALQRSVAELRSDHREAAQRLSAKVAGAEEVLAEHRARADEAVALLEQQGEEARGQASRLAELAGRADEASEQLGTLGGKLMLLEQAQELAGEQLEPRLASLQESVESLRAAAQRESESLVQLRKESESLREQSSELAHGVHDCLRQVREVEMGAEVRLEEQFSTLDKRIAEGENNFIDLVALVEDLQDKVHRSEMLGQAEVAALRSSVRTVAAEVKEKEQAVLFGAKCLSCNRVFDDVAPNAGVVDLQREKEREKVFTEIERALHNPAAAPSESIKMIAVKVGRAGHLHPAAAPGGLGPILGRDPKNPAFTSMDAHIAPTLAPAKVLRGAKVPEPPSGGWPAAGDLQTSPSSRAAAGLSGGGQVGSPPTLAALREKREELPRLKLSQLLDGGARLAQTVR